MAFHKYSYCNIKTTAIFFLDFQYIYKIIFDIIVVHYICYFNPKRRVFYN